MSLFDSLVIPPSVSIPPPPIPPLFEWTEEQQQALSTIDEWWERGNSNFVSLIGPAGTGKTTLAREVIARYPYAALAAMTGKAALRLSQLTGRAATTLHKILYYPPKPGEDVRFTKLREPTSGFIIIDESSMMTPMVFADLQKWANYGTRFLLVGDCFQLPPVVTGEDLKKYGEDYSVFTRTDGAALQTVMRNVGGVLRAATKVRETGTVCQQSDVDGDGVGYEYVECPNATDTAVRAYLSDREDHLLITWRNATRMKANRIIRAQLGHEGDLPDEGEPVLIKRNGQGFLNGEIVPCGGFDSGPMLGTLRCLWMKLGESKVLVSYEGGSESKGGEFFDGAMPWIEDWKKYHTDMKMGCYPEPIPVTWGYCLTAHSAQGSQAKRTTVFLDRFDLRSSHFNKPTTLPSGDRVSMSARWIYTATTRSTHHTTMIVGR